MIAELARETGWSPELLDESLDATIAPFTREALVSFAATVTPRERVGGFIMPGNIPGAGLHELLAALISGTAAIVKTSVREPVFFDTLARAIKEIDPVVGARLDVLAFDRKCDEFIELMEQRCDFIVALGDDGSIASLRRCSRLFGFGSRASGALISLAAPANLSVIADAIAREVTLFEQHGCLSPHHVFVEDPGGAQSEDFARALADALRSMAAILPSAKLPFQTAAAIRRIRERARWRSLGGQRIGLHEGVEMAWTVVFDPAARFTISPGYRTVTLTPVRSSADLQSRLEPVAGRLEAFALAVPPVARASWLEVLARAGVTYVCDPGNMQTPPMLWPHGGGAFIDFVST